MWLSLKNTELNINSAIEYERFGLNKGIDFSVDYRPLKTSIPLVSKWNKLANSTYNSKKTSTLIAIFGVLCIPLINTVIGAYLVGFVMVFMSLVSIRLLMHSTLDLLFYREMKRI